MDLALIMSVNPGFGGQNYIPASNTRIARLRKMLAECGSGGVEIQVDGGVDAQNAGMI